MRSTNQLRVELAKDDQKTIIRSFDDPRDAYIEDAKKHGYRARKIHSPGFYSGVFVGLLLGLLGFLINRIL